MADAAGAGEAPQGADQVWLEPPQARGHQQQAVGLHQRATNASGCRLLRRSSCRCDAALGPPDPAPEPGRPAYPHPGSYPHPKPYPLSFELLFRRLTFAVCSSPRAGVCGAAADVPAGGAGAGARRAGHPDPRAAPAAAPAAAPDLDPLHEEDPHGGGALLAAPHPHLAAAGASRAPLLPRAGAVRAPDGQLPLSSGPPAQLPRGEPPPVARSRRPHDPVDALRRRGARRRGHRRRRPQAGDPRGSSPPGGVAPRGSPGGHARDGRGGGAAPGRGCEGRADGRRHGRHR
eukprot:1175750-Prorocentrum_minimum.AAC.4